MFVLEVREDDVVGERDESGGVSLDFDFCLFGHGISIVDFDGVSTQE